MEVTADDCCKTQDPLVLTRYPLTTAFTRHSGTLQSQNIHEIWLLQCMRSAENYMGGSASSAAANKSSQVRRTQRSEFPPQLCHLVRKSLPSNSSGFCLENYFLQGILKRSGRNILVQFRAWWLKCFVLWVFFVFLAIVMGREISWSFQTTLLFLPLKLTLTQSVLKSTYVSNSVVFCDFVGLRDQYKGTIDIANILKISFFKACNLKKYLPNHNFHKVPYLSVSLNPKNVNVQGNLHACR